MTLTIQKPFWPSRYWWGALLLLLVIAGGLRYTGYNFSLPYVEHLDEPNFNIAGRMIIDSGSPKPLNMHGYPPGIIAINYVFLRLFHDPTTPPSTVLWMVRLVAITFNLGVMVVIGLLGYHIATPLAGLIGAGLWAVSWVMVEYSRYATADTFVTFFTVLALWLALAGTLYNRDRWTTASIIAIMLAIVFKYQAVFVAPVILMLPLWRLRNGVNRRKVVINFGVNLAWLVVFFAWLVFLTPALEANSVPNWVARFQGIPTPAVILYNIDITLRSMDMPVVLFGCASLLWLIWADVRRQVSLLGVAAVALTAIFWLLGITLYGKQDFRQFIALTALLITLGSVGLSGWEVAVRRILERAASRQSVRWAGAALFAAIALASVPNINAALANAFNHTLPDRRNDMAHWMDITLAPAPHIATRDNHKTLNGAWGGYAGRGDFPLADEAYLTDRPLEDWRREGVLYAIMPYVNYELLGEALNGQEYIDGTLLLKAYLPSDAYRGPDMAVLRLYPIQFPAEGVLGSIHLVGYDLDRHEVQSGETLNFSLYWQAEQPTDTEYVVFNHLVSMDSFEPLAQIDGAPLPDERRPTTTWDDPQETLVSRSFSLTADVPSGEYRLITGFYRRDTFERLLTPEGENYLLVTTITVREP